MALEEWKIREMRRRIKELGKAYIFYLKHEEAEANAAKEQIEALGYAVTKEWDGRAWRLTVTRTGPVDRNGTPLCVGDRVQLFSRCEGLFASAAVVGFELSPSYDRGCVGIHVDTQEFSIHPRLVEKMTEARDG